MTTSEFAAGPLYTLVGALDSLMQAAAAGEQLSPKDQVTLFNRTRVIGQWAIRYLAREQAEMLRAILHPDYFNVERKDYPTVSARASLAVLHGFLHGCIAEAQVSAQLEANARAYADAKVREERGVGFRRPS